MSLSPQEIGLIALAALFAMILLRVPIGVALSVTGALGYWALNGFDTMLFVLGSIPFETAYNYDLSVIPLFIFMGNFALVSGMSRDLYDTARALVGHWRGGLASATVVGCAGFAAVSGSSLASAVTMGRVSLPEMKRYHYSSRLATGVVAAGGTLGILIPPSTGFILYAILTEQSIGQLFVSGILPGLLLALLFMVTVWLLTLRDPEAGPSAPRLPWRERASAVRRSASVIIIVAIVLGGIYFGVFTPVEAAAVGAFATVVLTMIRRKLTWEALTFCTLETIKAFAFVFLIVIGAFLFNPFLALTHIPGDLAAWINSIGLSPLGVLLCVVGAYIVMGTFLEGFSMLVLSIPIVYPMIIKAGFDPIWFGTLVVITLEMGLITPPLGLNVFVVQGISGGVPMEDVFKGILPFFVAMLVCLALLIAFPEIALVLPQTMFGQ